jgi:hypothetical protein
MVGSRDPSQCSRHCLARRPGSFLAMACQSSGRAASRTSERRAASSAAVQRPMADGLPQREETSAVAGSPGGRGGWTAVSSPNDDRSLRRTAARRIKSAGALWRRVRAANVSTTLQRAGNGVRDALRRAVRCEDGGRVVAKWVPPTLRPAQNTPPATRRRGSNSRAAIQDAQDARQGTAARRRTRRWVSRPGANRDAGGETPGPAATATGRLKELRGGRPGPTRAHLSPQRSTQRTRGSLPNKRDSKAHPQSRDRQ